MTRKVYTINVIRGIMAPIAKKHGVKKVYLFGSYARVEATPSSDVDFCVGYFPWARYTPILKELSEKGMGYGRRQYFGQGNECCIHGKSANGYRR